MTGRFFKSAGPWFQIAAAATMALVALGLFVISRNQRQSPGQNPVSKELVSQIDREVDSVLTGFGVERSWVRKRNIPVPSAGFDRIEHRVAIPSAVLPVQVNAALNTMAKRHDGRAIASENLKENSVTIHIEIGGYLILTVVLKPDPKLKLRKADSPGLHT